jgi:hypothetical protein
MLEILIDSIFVEKIGHNLNKSLTSLWEQTETGFIKDKPLQKLNKAINLTFRYIDDILQIENLSLTYEL